MWHCDRWQIVMSHFKKYGAPLLALLVMGSYGLQQFTQLRYTYQKSKTLTQEEMKSLGIQKKENVLSLEEEFERMQQQIDIKNWQNVRGPRPWEPPSSEGNWGSTLGNILVNYQGECRGRVTQVPSDIRMCYEWLMFYQSSLCNTERHCVWSQWICCVWYLWFTFSGLCVHIWIIKYMIILKQVS